jgi:hypothetical protein
MDQPGHNELLLRFPQPGHLGYTGHHAADRMRDLLARTVQDHLARERDMASVLADLRRRLDALEQGNLGIAATLEGLAASLGTLDSRMATRVERLDERLDDQYDRVRSIESSLTAQFGNLDETIAASVATAVSASTGDIIARIASLEDTVLTLAEALLRPAPRVPAHALPGGNGLS